MGDLKSLQTITGLSLSTANIQNLVDEFRTFGVVAFGPIIAWVVKDLSKVLIRSNFSLLCP